MHKKIMIIDDEVELVDMVTRRLEASGYEVASLYIGTEAVYEVKLQKPDLILLDVMMPGKSGYQVAKDLKADPATEGIPIIFFTARFHRKEDIAKITEIDDYILKPFEPAELMSKIKTLLEDCP